MKRYKKARKNKGFAQGAVTTTYLNFLIYLFIMGGGAGAGAAKNLTLDEMLMAREDLDRRTDISEELKEEIVTNLKLYKINRLQKVRKYFPTVYRVTGWIRDKLNPYSYFMVVPGDRSYNSSNTKQDLNNIPRATFIRLFNWRK